MSKHSLFKSQDIRKQKYLFKRKFFFFVLLDQVRNYFGENVAYYFAFLEFYTKALIPTSILGKISPFIFRFFIIFFSSRFIR